MLRRSLGSLVAGATAALALIAALAPPESRAADPIAKGKVKEALRPIAREFAADGDLAKALEKLKAAKASPADLLATLRAPAPLTGEAAAGERSLEITDGYGTKTDLLVIAPTAQQLEARTREKKPLGLVVLLHGIKGNANQAREIATQIASTGEVVCVAPSAKPVPASVGPEDGIPAAVAKQFPHWWLYESDRSFVFEAIKLATSQYAIDPDRVVLAGMSMGGYGTWNIGLRHADRFAGIAPLAGGLSRLSQFMGMKDERTWSLLENGRNFPVFAAHGDKDEVVPYAPDKEAADALKALGGDIDFRTLEGVGHSVAGLFGPSAPGGGVAKDLFAFVRSKRRTSSPRRVVYTSISEKLDGAYWLRIAARSPGAKAGIHVEGELDRARGRIDVSSRDAASLRVYLDDRALDPSKAVVVSVQGRDVARAKIEPEFAAILESWRSRQDPALVYPAFVEIEARP